MLVAGGGLRGPVLCGWLEFRRAPLFLGLILYYCIRDSRVFSVALTVVVARVGDLRDCLNSSLLTDRGLVLWGLDRLRY